uniref:TIGR01777 family oxidoreductase n=1 Tax=Ornithobacterium rhinotracheale TaxID=28251 RepID=UPI0039A69CD4
MKIVISGGTGYLGSLLVDYYKTKAQVYVLTRSPKKDIPPMVNQVVWDAKNLGDWANCLENADALINLAGKSINTRMTEKNKQEILQSRIDATEALGKAIEACKVPPKMWLNASSIAIYDESRREEKTEYSDLNGTDFLSEVCRKWEMAFYRYAEGKTKKAVFRISLVLGEHKGSALHTLKRLVQFGGGGKAGSGTQMVSWVSERDFVRAIAYIVKHELEGDFNIANGSAVSNKLLMEMLRKKYKRSFGLSAPKILIKLGGEIIGTPPELILRSQNVIPKRLWKAGFNFLHESVLDI